MAWEEVEKKGPGSSCHYGENWEKYPCVAINKTGITFNRPSAETILRDVAQVAIAFDRDSMMIRFKTFLRGEESAQNFTLTNDTKSKTKGSTIRLACKRLCDAFPDFHGLAFRAFRTADGFIEVSLSHSSK